MLTPPDPQNADPQRADSQKELRDDVRRLGALLGDTLRAHEGVLPKEEHWFKAFESKLMGRETATVTA